MAVSGSKWCEVKAPPPRTLNVQKFAESRASELENLHSIVANRVKNDFRSMRNKRRRTTGHDDRVLNKRCRKRRKLGVIKSSNCLDLKKDPKKVTRQVRRRLELRKNAISGYSTSGDGTKRLRTHLWHAKRFTMTKLWGFHLPLGLQGRGLGSRSVLKRLKSGALVHDASYFGAVQLEGPEDSLLSILSTVLVPAPSAHSEDCHSLLSGLTFGSAMLHHAGAPVSQPICPLTYIWRPNTAVGEENHNTYGYDKRSSRQVWVWMHPSAFNEGYDALKFASHIQMDYTGTLVNCSSLADQLAKLEVMGLKSSQLLQKILHPVTSSEGNPWQLKQCSVAGDGNGSQLKKSSIFENEEHMFSHAIIPLIVNDPRTLPGKRSEVVSEATSTTPESSSISNADLWHAIACNGINPPVEESVLCMEKHQERLASFCLVDSNPGSLQTLPMKGFSRVCPILLLKDNNHHNALTRWLVILPISWVKAFWISFISKGAHAIGLREKRWIACDVGLPCFPSDFPDCSAYSFFKATEDLACEHKANLRALALRPSRVPIPPPWNTIILSFEKESTEIQVAQSSHENSSNGSCDVTSPCSHGFISNGFVARTSIMLPNLLKNSHDDKFIISRNVPQINYDGKLCFVRVLLHAYKEGVFEEGAVVCAPNMTDLLSWTSRSGSLGGFEISQMAMLSYFKQQSFGQWVLEIPEDPVALKSHRWPIGFVTSGFVRGSKKSMAVAVCEANLLARLRSEQWNHELKVKRRRKDIYVLVRNLRSTAYRLGLATVILEQQLEDVDFL